MAHGTTTTVSDRTPRCADRSSTRLEIADDSREIGRSIGALLQSQVELFDAPYAYECKRDT